MALRTFHNCPGVPSGIDWAGRSGITYFSTMASRESPGLGMMLLFVCCLAWMRKGLRIFTLWFFSQTRSWAFSITELGPPGWGSVKSSQVTWSGKKVPAPGKQASQIEAALSRGGEGRAEQTRKGVYENGFGFIFSSFLISQPNSVAGNGLVVGGWSWPNPTMILKGIKFNRVKWSGFNISKPADSDWPLDSGLLLARLRSMVKHSTNNPGYSRIYSFLGAGSGTEGDPIREDEKFNMKSWGFFLRLIIFSLP